MTTPHTPSAALRPSRHPRAGLPIGRPLGSPRTGALAVARAASRDSRGTDTPHPSSSAGLTLARRHRRARVGARVRGRLASSLSDRDRQVLTRIWEHRYLTTGQLQAFCFTQHASHDSAARTSRRVLARLERDSLIRALGRRIGGVRAGSEAKVWQLAPAGARILLPNTGHSWRTHEPSERFLAHTLAVADCHLTIRADAPSGASVAVQTEPASWRRYLGLGGETRLIRPDLAVHISGTDHHGTWDDYWFIEVDMGTESIPSLIAKCHAYQQYYTSGQEQTQRGSFPRVLWLMHGPKAHHRSHNLTRRILRTPSLQPAMFTITTADQAAGVLGGGDTNQALNTAHYADRKDTP